MHYFVFNLATTQFIRPWEYRTAPAAASVTRPIPVPRSTLNGRLQAAQTQSASAQTARPIPAPRRLAPSTTTTFESSMTASNQSMASIAGSSPGLTVDESSRATIDSDNTVASTSSNDDVIVMKTSKDKPCIGYRGYVYRFSKEGKIDSILQ